ncbi:MAG: 2-oxoacid:acceptor oxidoreductase family protein [Candidatus Methylomirabilia bacterium]
MNTARPPWNPAVESLSRDEIQALQWQRLRAQLAYNYARSPFYRHRFEQAGIKPEDIRSWDHFRKIPTMNKHDHRQAQEESIEQYGHPFGMLACASQEKFIILNATSGTTGIPTLYTVTMHDLKILNELQARKFWRVGLRPGDRVLHAYSLSMFVGGIPLIEAIKSYGACAVPVGAEVGSRRALDFAGLVRPKALICTPSYAEYLAEKAPEITGRPVRELGIELLMCGGEPGAGLPEVRRRVQEAYGAVLYDAIGATHTLHGISCDLPEYQGMHLVSEDYCVLELLDPETKGIVELRDGAMGEMVFTYLDWEGTPFLRYALGDILQVFTSPCACGWPGLRFKILGRSDDMLIVKGVNVYPAAIRNVVVSFAPRTTGQMRILLDQPGHRVTPPLRLVVEHGPEVAGPGIPALKAVLEQMIHEKLKVRPEVQMVAPGTLERATHKTKLIEIRPSGPAEARANAEPGVASSAPVRPAAKETNLVCMSGQGSVQAVEIMAKAYFEQQRKYVGSVVFPGSRSKSSPVVSYLKVSDRPVASTSTNYEPSEVVVFWDGLLRVAAQEGHPVVRDAIARLRRGVLLVNTKKAPEEIAIPFEFKGAVATVDASEIARRHLKRNPPPVGVTLLGAYTAVTGTLEMDALMRLVRERFPGSLGERNVEAAREAHGTVRVVRDVRGRPVGATEERGVRASGELPEWFPIEKELMRGYRDGSPYVWRDKIPVCDDAKCRCKELCLSEALCPDNTGFIVRRGIQGAAQGYRVDVDFCRGCGICVEVCVYGALRMVPEEDALRTHPDYGGITVEPYRAPVTAGGE